MKFFKDNGYEQVAQGHKSESKYCTSENETKPRIKQKNKLRTYNFVKIKMQINQVFL